MATSALESCVFGFLLVLCNATVDVSWGETELITRMHTGEPTCADLVVLGWWITRMHTGEPTCADLVVLGWWLVVLCCDVVCFKLLCGLALWLVPRCHVMWCQVMWCGFMSCRVKWCDAMCCIGSDAERCAVNCCYDNDDDHNNNNYNNSNNNNNNNTNTYNNNDNNNNDNNNNNKDYYYYYYYYNYYYNYNYNYNYYYNYNYNYYYNNNNNNNYYYYYNCYYYFQYYYLSVLSELLCNKVIGIFFTFHQNPYKFQGPYDIHWDGDFSFCSLVLDVNLCHFVTACKTKNYDVGKFLDVNWRKNYLRWTLRMSLVIATTAQHQECLWSVIRDSQQPISPIAFFLFWNLRYRLLRYDWNSYQFYYYCYYCY